MLKVLKKKTLEHDQSTKSVAPLIVKGLYKRYFGNKEFSIQNLNFEVRPGEFHGFIGANGAGKTTTIKSIVGAYASFKGEIKIFGHKQSSIQGKKRIGYIPEVANFPTELNALQYLKHMAQLSGMPKKEAVKFAKKKLVDVGMEKLQHRNPNHFSSGQKKKILLAQALIGEPDLIIMDEPAANLDPRARKDFFDNLKQLQEIGKAIFISSHILVEIAQYIDSVTIIDHGKLAYSGKIIDAIKPDVLKYVFMFQDDNSKNHFIKSAQKLKFTIKTNGNKELVIALEKKADVHKLLKIVTNNKLDLVYAKQDIKSLQNIYDDYVSKTRDQHRKNLINVNNKKNKRSKYA